MTESLAANDPWPREGSRNFCPYPPPPPDPGRAPPRLLPRDGRQLRRHHPALGAILAVVVLYWKRFCGWFRPSRCTPSRGYGACGCCYSRRFPAGLVGLALTQDHQGPPVRPATVALALAVGALMIFWVERRRPGTAINSLERDDAGLGARQSAASSACRLWPGFSRSAATIMGGMLLGAKRSLAAEYSFISAVAADVRGHALRLLQEPGPV